MEERGGKGLPDAGPESGNHEWSEDYLALANAAGDGILIIQDGVIVFANPSTVRLFGVPAGQVVGTSFLDFVFAGDHEGAGEVYRAARDNKNLSAAERRGFGEMLQRLK